MVSAASGADRPTILALDPTMDSDVSRIFLSSDADSNHSDSILIIEKIALLWSVIMESLLWWLIA